MPPAEPREFRAAWVATVANIDWPSKPGLSAASQRAEALALLNRAQQIGLNALILQVRPAADAIYPSTLEPWSEYLSGEQGRGPGQPGDAAYDPLAFWLAQARLRGIELHAWVNPYRVRQAGAKSPLAASHWSWREPGVVKRYGEQLWADPGEPAAAAQTLAVVADLLRRYDLDGVHMDDYFYPYPVKPADKPDDPNDLPFPDEESYARYVLGGGSLAKDDWRRDNVDRLVQALYRTAQSTRPGVRVGISPFGVGRPDRRPPGVIGFSQYDKLYADVERWLKEGWMDYLAPQLYWQSDREGLQFTTLLDQWLLENTARRHVWPGLFTSLVTRGEPLGQRSWPAREILAQIGLQRARSGADRAADKVATGHIHFSMVALLQDRDGIATQLQNGPYAQPALVPATPWLDASVPAAPQLLLGAGGVRIQPASGPAPRWWALWRRVGGAWVFSVLPGGVLQLDAAGADALVISAISRTGIPSARTVLRLP
jgi:uncharacterized lipoprotein YddW (UPF0748 family)